MSGNNGHNLNGVEARIRKTGVADLVESGGGNHNKLSLRHNSRPSRVAIGEKGARAGAAGAGMDNKVQLFQFQKGPKGSFCIAVRHYIKIVCNVPDWEFVIKAGKSSYPAKLIGKFVV